MQHTLCFPWSERHLGRRQRFEITAMATPPVTPALLIASYRDLPRGARAAPGLLQLAPRAPPPLCLPLRRGPCLWEDGDTPPSSLSLAPMLGRGCARRRGRAFNRTALRGSLSFPQAGKITDPSGEGCSGSLGGCRRDGPAGICPHRARFWSGALVPKARAPAVLSAQSSGRPSGAGEEDGSSGRVPPGGSPRSVPHLRAAGLGMGLGTGRSRPDVPLDVSGRLWGGSVDRDRSGPA